MTQYHQKKSQRITIFQVMAAVLLQRLCSVLAALEDPVLSGSHISSFPITPVSQCIFLMIILIKWNLILKNGKNWDYPFDGIVSGFRL